MFRKLCHALALPLALLMLVVLGPLTAAQAAMVSTEALIAGPQAAQDRERVLALLERQEVRAELVTLGVDPGVALERVQALSDAEISQIAGRLDEMEAGQGLGPVIGAAVLIFLVLLVTDILCLTNVFSFTRCSR
ncbi:PA2779 family protein [Futiania mangrovi]|uniref:PA2779 family protein n=1 Tax=Futiania mangrovi TaxID=2959716 RepID=A0A9J6PH44_9PROT|nr:PA2779 family protein [Futiania mangrovii]MCP1337131.1 PA2779 family protein [Futiania mangrovii]